MLLFQTKEIDRQTFLNRSDDLSLSPYREPLELGLGRVRKIFLTKPGSLLYLVHNSRVVIPSPPLYWTVSTFVFKVNLCCRVRAPVDLYRDVLRDVPPQIQTAHRHGQRRGLPGGPGGPALSPPRPGGAHLQPGQWLGRGDGEVNCIGNLITSRDSPFLDSPSWQQNCEHCFLTSFYEKNLSLWGIFGQWW